MSKYTRLLQILNLLRIRPGISAKDLALDCQVSRRTIFRDILSLCSAEIPVFYDRGYRLLPGTFLPTLNFDLDEYLTLKGILSADLFNNRYFFGNTIMSVLSKIEISLNSDLKEKLKELCSPLYFSFHRSNGDKDQALIFKLLKEAILEKRGIVLNYGIQEICKFDFKVDPISLVLRQGRWYLVGNCKNSGGYFPFGLEYIKKVTLTNNNFILTKDFSLDDYFENSLGVCQDRLINVELKLLKENRYFLDNISNLITDLSKHKDGSILCRLKVKGVNELARWLLGFSGEVEVKRPIELKSILFKLWDNQQKLNQKGSRVRRWAPVCPLYKKYKFLCNDFCLDPVF
ncbi:MAG: WYL domain-containing protein [candidate division Zixibacteria bacterium]|nr:WYL domain-containing protein [candidate division Zixibacteria bacterium]